MLDPLVRVSAALLASCLGWVTMSPPGLTSTMAVPQVGLPPVSLTRVVLAQESPDLQGRYDLDPFYTPEFNTPESSPSAVRTRIVWARVTACSPLDPADKQYYARHGYAGAALNIAADYRVFPKGTRIRVPGYMETSYPGHFWSVDSPGGSVIRSSTAEGVPHIDVKFRTLYSAKKWGCQWLALEVQDP